MRDECNGLSTAAARLPGRRLPADSQFERPSAIARIWFSTQLLSIGKLTRAGQEQTSEGRDFQIGLFHLRPHASRYIMVTRTTTSQELKGVRAALEATAWALSFRIEAPVSYKEGLDFAMDPGLRVFLHHTDENGEPQWAICVEERPEFWMDAVATRAKAVAICKTMGWKIVRA